MYQPGSGSATVTGVGTSFPNDFIVGDRITVGEWGLIFQRDEFADHGRFDGGRQVGFARVISDRATFAYVCDVFVLPGRRGRGVGARIMACITSHPELQNLRLWTLFTRDAHGLYRQHGFRDARHPDRLMERRAERPYALSEAGHSHEERTA